MLVPWSFMFNKSFQDFREDFVGGRGSFDFFSEFGYDILDNATVGTVGTVVRSDTESGQTGTFIRLPDVSKAEKEQTFLEASFDDSESDVQRLYHRDLAEFDMVPGTPLSYWVPQDLRSLYDSEVVLDADNGRVDRESYGDAKVGLQTGDDGRFTRRFWEANSQNWYPFAKGGADSWILPRVKRTVWWEDDGAEIKRYYGSRPQNTEYYFSESLTYTVAKRSGRRFGYLHESSIFGHKGSVLVPDRAIWNALSYTNSHLFTYLMLTQTSERMWEIGFVSKVPWRKELEDINKLEELSREAVGHLISKRQYDFVSPYYNNPVLLEVLDIDDPLPQYHHPHRELRDKLTINEPEETVTPDSSLKDIAVAAARHLERIEADLQSCADAIDEAVFECFDITDDQRETVLQEIALRTIEDPREREEYDPETITEPPEDYPEMVKDLLLHLSIRIVHEDDDGNVPLTNVENEEDLLSRIEAEFERLFGEYASARLAEVDQALGSQTADKEAYPNLREWLESDLFDYHISTFDRTPILWEFTTERLVSDPVGEGFACLVDYHQIDPSLFDRIESRYLEPLKAEYRDRRTAADQRRSDSSLPTSEQAEAADEYAHYESALAQINEFQEAALELSSQHPPNRDEVVQSTAAELKPKVAEFRERTANRLDTLDKLVKEMDPNEFEDQFSPTFLERVNEHRGEWLGSLEELEAACEAYTRNASSPVEAHLYDLFEYIDENVGSTHYGSNDITFMNYYFSKGDQYLNDGEPREGLEGEASLMAELAAETDRDVELGEEIKEKCNQLSKALPSEWEERALEEVMASGYSPVKKHGVAVNIKPLAENKLVPEVVEDKVVN